MQGVVCVFVGVVVCLWVFMCGLCIVYVADILYVYMCGVVCVQRVYVSGVCRMCMRYCAYVRVWCVCWKCVPPFSFLLTVEYRETAFLQIPLFPHLCVTDPCCPKGAPAGLCS